MAVQKTRSEEEANAEERSDLSTPNSLIRHDLHRKYGGANALDPGHGPGGLQIMAEGDAITSSKNAN